MARKDIVRNVTIERLERLNLSVNGNPRFHVWFTDGTDCITQSDSGFAYAIENPEYRGVEFEAHFTRAGRLAYGRTSY